MVLLSGIYGDSHNFWRDLITSQIILPEEAASLISQYDIASDEEKEAASRKNEAANKLKSMLGENESGICGEKAVIWKNVSTERFDSKALKAADPDLYAKYVSKSASRRFNVK